MSFWDRGMDVFFEGLGWEDFEMVQYIGGIGMYLSSEEIYKTYGVYHSPFQYPLGTDNAYEYCNKYRNNKKKE